LSSDIEIITNFIVAAVGLSGVIGIFLGIRQYREGQILKRKETLFDIIEEFDKSEKLKLSRMILDGFSFRKPDWEHSKEEKDYYHIDNLQFILRDHKKSRITDYGEMEIRESFDALLEFLGKVGYLLDRGILKKEEYVYFRDYVDVSLTNLAIMQYRGIYRFPMFEEFFVKHNNKK